MHTILHPSGDDDTPALLQAMGSGGNVVEFIARCGYILDAPQPQHGTTFLGFGGNNYTNPADYNGPRLMKKAGAACILDCSQAPRSVNILGLMLDGVDGTAPGISGGSCHLNIERSYVTDCLIGLGGAVNGGSAYTYVITADRVKIVNCRQHAINSPVDSGFVECVCANNAVNVYGLPGANHNRFESGRYEWPTSGENFRLCGTEDDPVRDWSLAGAIQLDRAATAQIFLRHCHNIELFIPSSGRPGRIGATDAGQSTHVYCENCDTVSAVGIVMWKGANDDGSGIVSPAHAWQFKGVNRDIIIGLGSVAKGYTSDVAIDYIDGCTPETMPGHKIGFVGGLKNFHH